MRGRNLHKFNVKMTYNNNNNKSFSAENFILGENSASQFYVVKCNRNITKKGFVKENVHLS